MAVRWIVDETLGIESGSLLLICRYELLLVLESQCSSNPAERVQVMLTRMRFLGRFPGFRRYRVHWW